MITLLTTSTGLSKYVITEVSQDRRVTFDLMQDLDAGTGVLSQWSAACGKLVRYAFKVGCHVKKMLGERAATEIPAHDQPKTRKRPMNAEYDPLAEAYYESKYLPFRVYSEIPNHLELLGDVSGKQVLDLACGEGFYTRLIKAMDAAFAVGMDLSEEMIQLARQKEAESPLGIKYYQGTAADLSSLSLGHFEIASTAYLFNCAKDQVELEAMFQQIASCLSSGGRLVATVGDLGHRADVDYSPYGMKTDIPADTGEGDPYSITFVLKSESFSITDFNHSRDTYEKLCVKSGFEFEGWLPCTVTPEGLEKYGKDFWKTWVDNPCIWRFSARKR